MKFFIAYAAAAQLASAAVDIKSVKHASTNPVVPNSYIIELSPHSHLKRGFASPHEELYHDLKRRGATWEVKREYSGDLLTGASVKLGSSFDLTKLAEATGVQSITPIYLREPPTPVYHQVMRRDNNSKDLTDTFPPHAMTGVDKLHAEGYFGKGIKIGIIDSGIDYTHPALGGKFGPGNKVIGGYDFVGDDYTGLPDSPPLAPDNDPLDQCNGHGTHVAGTIGADPNNAYNVSGIAYQSEINAYRVFGCKGSAPDDALLESLVRAYEDGNDVITLSLGGVNGWSESAPGVVASRIADKGRIVTIAVGNDGEFGAWYTASPATGLDVISVGSIDNVVLYNQNVVVSNGRKISYQSPTPVDIPAGLTVFATSNDPTIPNDACDPLPNSTPDLSDRLVLIHRGTCNFTTKLDNAAAKGGRYFLVYDDKDQPLSRLNFGNYTATLITQADGLFLLQEAIPNKYTVSFPNSPSASPNPNGGLMSPFSNYGPSYDMYLKPAFSAPGGAILSTWPVPLGSWAVESGTSMATPFVAGSAALLLQVRGKNAGIAKAARSIFQNTAIPVKRTKDDSSLIATAAHQGAGLLNVYDAIKTMGSLTPSELLLNDTANFKGQHTLMLSNYGKKPVTYELTHVPAGTANTISGIQVNQSVPLVNKAATVTITPSKIMVPAGSTLPVNVTLEPPAGLDAKMFPVYSGYIVATGSDDSALQSTYMGVAANLKDAKILDNTGAYFDEKLPLITDGEGKPVPPEGRVTYSMNGSDTPSLLYRLVMGTPLMRLDLVDSRTNVTNHGGSFADVKTLGVLFQQEYIPRNSDAPTAAANGHGVIPVATFANDTAIPNGSYKILVRVLKITGNPTKEKDYEAWTSPEVVVKRD